MGSVAARCPPFMALLTFVHKGILNIVARCDQHRPVSTAFDRDQTSDPCQSRPDRPSRFCPASGVSVLPVAFLSCHWRERKRQRSRSPPTRPTGPGVPPYDGSARAGSEVGGGPVPLSLLIVSHCVCRNRLAGSARPARPARHDNFTSSAPSPVSCWFIASACVLLRLSDSNSCNSCNSMQ